MDVHLALMRVAMKAAELAHAMLGTDPGSPTPHELVRLAEAAIVAAAKITDIRPPSAA